MQARYALRFDSGERKGELIPISGVGVTIGRKPGNSVQILDPSVSGRHAEFALDGNGIVLRDLGSTNGVKVGGERVSERRLEHADQVMLGNIRLTFLDSERPAPPASEGDGLELELESAGGRGEPPSAPSDAHFDTAPSSSARSSSGSAAQQSSDAVRTISADKVARSSKLSLAGGAGLLVAVVAGAGGWWWIRSQEGAGGAAAARSVEVTSGNLLGASFSFEGVELDVEGAPWSNDPAHAAAFAMDGGSRRSGDDGVGAVLTAGQSAQLRSGALPLSGARHLELKAWLRVDGEARARIGLEFESSTDASARTLVWSGLAGASNEFELLEWSCGVPPGFDAVRVVLGARARGESAVDADDLVLLVGSDPAPALAQDSFQLVALGASPNSAVLFKIDRTLLSDIHVRGADGERAEFTPASADGAFTLALSTGGEGAMLSMRADGPLTAAAPVSLGEGGYRSHGASFERDGLSRLLLGAGKDQVAIGFDVPARVQARTEGAGLRLEFSVRGASRATIQVTFRAERETALAIARQAREAERADRLGECMATWLRLRDEAPFDSELLAEGETTRARLAELGATEVRALRAEVERARFFRLVEIYRQSRTRAEALGTRFAGSELEVAAGELVVEVRRELDVLEADLNKTERARLEDIARALSAGKSERLAARVKEYLDEHFAASGGASSGGGR